MRNALLAAVLLAVPALADQREGEGIGRKGPPPFMGVHEKMKARLGLTEEQDAKVRKAREAHAAALRDLGAKRRKDMDLLEEQVRGMAPEKEISETLERLEAGRKAMSDEGAKLHAAIAAALKPSQRAKMLLMMGGMGPGGRHRMGKRRVEKEVRVERDGPPRDGKDEGYGEGEYGGEPDDD